MVNITQEMTKQDVIWPIALTWCLSSYGFPYNKKKYYIESFFQQTSKGILSFQREMLKMATAQPPPGYSNYVYTHTQTYIHIRTYTYICLGMRKFDEYYF